MLLIICNMTFCCCGCCCARSSHCANCPRLLGQKRQPPDCPPWWWYHHCREQRHLPTLAPLPPPQPHAALVLLLKLEQPSSQLSPAPALRLQATKRPVTAVHIVSADPSWVPLTPSLAVATGYPILLLSLPSHAAPLLPRRPAGCC
jgi:hypothetical protein